MKKIFLFFLMFIFIIPVFAQKGFVWDSIYDSEATKDQLYSRAKFVMAEVFKSANDVIQNEDKEAGIILGKAATIIHRSENIGFVDVKHTFRYTVKIMVKDNKYRITIDNVNNSYVWSTANPPDYFMVVPVEDESTKYKMNIKGYRISNKTHQKLMLDLRIELQMVFNRISKEMKNNLSEINSDW